jgi:hypothetical protein
MWQGRATITTLTPAHLHGKPSKSRLQPTVAQSLDLFQAVEHG